MRLRSSATILLVAATALAPSDVDAQMPPIGTSTTPAPDAVEILAEAVDAISTMHMEAFSDSLLWEAAIDGLIESLNDPYAELFTPVEAEAWEEETTGNYSGIGLQITLLNDEVTVTAVFRGTPAEDIGIVEGDVIVGVNAHDASDWDTGMTADSIRGPVGSTVNVRFKRPGYENPLAYTIKRAEVHVPAVNYGVMEGNIGYVVLDRVARNAAREMNEALAELQSTSGLVIDLRRNPGGFLDESLMLADLFLKPGSTLASTVQRAAGGGVGENSTDSYNDRWPQLVPDLPIIILVDRYTASGAEILAGALQDYDRAIVVGERSFGKGVVQTVMPLPHNRRLRFTTGSWHTPLGRSLQRNRDRQLRPIEEDIDTFPRVTTPGGRQLINGGGIFADLEVADDTLTLRERELIQYSGENQFPLALRLAETGFAIAAVRRDANAPASVSDDDFSSFMSALSSEGLPAEFADDPALRDYLNWRLRMTVAARMNDLGAEADFRRERDPVLTEAIRLLGTTTSQAELFEAVDGINERRASEKGGS